MKITIQLSDMVTTIEKILNFEDVMAMALMYNPN